MTTVCLYKAQPRMQMQFFLFRAGGSLCCGLAFSSRGMVAAGDDALRKRIAAIEEVTLDDDYVVHWHGINAFCELRRIRVLLSSLL
jgi:Fe-S oxidoreductase